MKFKSLLFNFIFSPLICVLGLFEFDYHEDRLLTIILIILVLISKHFITSENNFQSCIFIPQLFHNYLLLSSF